MKKQIYSVINSLIYAILIIVAALTPLIFLSKTTNFFDMPKLILLVVATLVLYGLWTVSWIVQGRMVVTKTALDVPLIVLLVVLLASTIFSTSKYASIFGIFPEVHGSAVSWVTYILLYFVAASNLKKESQVKTLLQVLFASAVVVSLISLFAYFWLFLPFDIAKSVNFTSTGSTFSTVSLILLLLPLSLVSSVKRNKFLPQPIAVIASILFSATVILIGSVSTYFVLLVIFISCLYVVKDQLNGKGLALLLTPFALAILVLALSYVPFSGNGLYDSRSNFPSEVQLPFNISWKISASAFRDAPFLGTGPSTFLYNFTNYKPVEFNQLRFWNFSFSTAYSELLQALGTWGLFGFITLLGVCAAILVYAKKYLLSKNLHLPQNDMRVLLPGLAISGVVVVLLLLIHATTLVFVVTTFLLLAAFMASHKISQEKVSDLSIGIKVASSDNKQIDLVPIIMFILYIVPAVFVTFRAYDVVAADYYHRLALSQAVKDGTKTYEYLQHAENLNPYIDLYRVDMAQTNFALANALASQKGPTKDNPQGTLTDQDKQTIQTLITQSINEGRASVVLSPRSSRNWEVLALIYRNITGVAENSLTFSLDAYGRAIQMDPYNPTLRVNVGSIYYGAKNYDLAVKFYTDSINLKPDYVNGYYNLAIALRDKGDLENAQRVAEQAVALLQKDLSSGVQNRSNEMLKETWVKDYKTASDLLNGIKKKVDEQSKAQETALQNPNLPSIDVPDLDNPPETTTPPEVVENPEVKLPELTPSVTVTPTPAP